MLKPLYCCDKYLVDSDGYIISKRDKRPMKPSISSHGYYITTVIIDGKRKSIPIHSAVAKTFLGDRISEGLVINHIDGNKLNNRLENLEWVTSSENARHAIDILGKNYGANNHNAKTVYGINKKTHQIEYQFPSVSDCARAICGDQNPQRVKTRIWYVITGRRKTYKGCYWTYKKPDNI